MTPEATPLRAPLKPGSGASKRPARTVKDRSESVPLTDTDTVRETSIPFTKTEKQMVDDLSGLYTLIGVAVGVANRDVATAIVENGEDAAQAWVTLAQRNPKVKAMLLSMTAATVWGAIVAVHLKMLSPAIAMPGREPPVVQQPGFQVMPDFMGEPLNPDAVDLAMQMMAGMRDTETGGPGDTIRVPGNGNGSAPIGSAEYVPPPMDPADYPFPLDSSPPQG
jgi:hypothetical protein